MKEYFSAKRASHEIGVGNIVKMISSDFKTHLFKKSNNYKRPVLHEIQRSLGRPMITSMTYDEFREKYKDNEFFIYEEN